MTHRSELNEVARGWAIRVGDPADEAAVDGEDWGDRALRAAPKT